jgi:hypothetical protein
MINAGGQNGVEPDTLVLEDAQFNSTQLNRTKKVGKTSDKVPSVRMSRSALSTSAFNSAREKMSAREEKDAMIVYRDSAIDGEESGARAVDWGATRRRLLRPFARRRASCVVAVGALIVLIAVGTSTRICVDAPTDAKPAPPALPAAYPPASPPGSGEAPGRERVCLDGGSYFAIGVVIYALLLMANDNPPDLCLLGATVILRLARINSAEDSWQA